MTVATIIGQAAKSGTFDIWMLILAILGIAVSLAIGGIAVYYASRSASYAKQSVTLTQQGLEVQDRQLRLQEEQATMRPRLEAADIRFYRPEDSSEVRYVLREVEENRRKGEQGRAAEEDRKQKYAEWERQKKEKERKLQNDPLPRLGPRDLSGLAERNPYEQIMIPRVDPTRYLAGHRYDGPKPDAILEFQIANKGKTAAHDISGTSRLDASYLHPLDFPAMDNLGISGPDEGFFEVDLVRVSELLPEHTFEYKIALRAKHPGSDNKVVVQYEFITPDGVTLNGEMQTEMVPGSPR